MKNFVHFTFIISLLLVFSGCSKDDDDENKPMSSIRVKIHYDSEGESPEGQFMIFDLENNNIQNFEPHYRDAIGYYLIDTNGELVTLSIATLFSHLYLTNLSERHTTKRTAIAPFSKRIL